MQPWPPGQEADTPMHILPFRLAADSGPVGRLVQDLTLKGARPQLVSWLIDTEAVGNSFADESNDICERDFPESAPSACCEGPRDDRQSESNEAPSKGPAWGPPAVF